MLTQANNGRRKTGRNGNGASGNGDGRQAVAYVAENGTKATAGKRPASAKVSQYSIGGDRKSLAAALSHGTTDEFSQLGSVLDLSLSGKGSVACNNSRGQLPEIVIEVRRAGRNTLGQGQERRRGLRRIVNGEAEHCFNIDGGNGRGAIGEPRNVSWNGGWGMKAFRTQGGRKPSLEGDAENEA
jgi:hypothetical protein